MQASLPKMRLCASSSRDIKAVAQRAQLFAQSRPSSLSLSGELRCVKTGIPMSFDTTLLDHKD